MTIIKTIRAGSLIITTGAILLIATIVSAQTHNWNHGNINTHRNGYNNSYRHHYSNRDNYYPQHRQYYNRQRGYYPPPPPVVLMPPLMVPGLEIFLPLGGY
jgi:hypothetical protein